MNFLLVDIQNDMLFMKIYIHNMEGREFELRSWWSKLINNFSIFTSWIRIWGLNEYIICDRRMEIFSSTPTNKPLHPHIFYDIPILPFIMLFLQFFYFIIFNFFGFLHTPLQCSDTLKLFQFDTFYRIIK
jgi:hypothetical protein